MGPGSVGYEQRDTRVMGSYIDNLTSCISSERSECFVNFGILPGTGARN